MFALLGLAAVTLNLTAATAGIRHMGVISVISNTSITRVFDDPVAITAGSDRALWFTDGAANLIGRITYAGKVKTYIGSAIVDPRAIAAGPDGALWFTNGTNSIGRITTGGSATNFTNANIHSPGGIVAGPDGALWFTN